VVRPVDGNGAVEARMVESVMREADPSGKRLWR
jgi:hypothetical protein